MLSFMSKHDDFEHRALQTIMNHGSEGILQCNLWQELDGSSREGSRISIKLEKKGLIERRRELSEGRWTYRLFSKRRPIAIDTILDIPCVVCTDILKCSAGNTVSTNACEKLSVWLMSIANKVKASES